MATITDQVPLNARFEIQKSLYHIVAGFDQHLCHLLVRVDVSRLPPQLPTATSGTNAPLALSACCRHSSLCEYLERTLLSLHRDNMFLSFVHKERTDKYLPAWDSTVLHYFMLLT